MSAFVVGREHIRFLVEAGMTVQSWQYNSPLRWRHNDESHTLPAGDPFQGERVGQMLWDACVDSVMARYPSDGADDLPGTTGDYPYKYGRHDFILMPADPLMVLQACRCYAYQSCEHPGWKESEAFAFVKALEGACVSKLIHGVEGGWEVDDAEAACRWRPRTAVGV